MKLHTNGFHLAGYSFLLQKFQISGMHHWHTSSVLVSGTRKTRKRNGTIEEMYSPRYWPGNTVGDHLEFALKYDGVNLEILSALFEQISESELTEFILKKPTGRYTRRIWFYYEYITGKRLPIEDCTTGNYVDALERDYYYTLNKGIRSRRHRVVDNLLGVPTYCPIIRKTRVLGSFDTSLLQKRSADMLSSFSPEIFERTNIALIDREATAVYALDDASNGSKHKDLFLKLLRESESWKELSFEVLQSLHAKATQSEEQISESNRRLLDGLIQTHNRLKAHDVAPIVHAVAIASGFLLIAPFSSGNTMVHRVLLHHILASRQLIHPPIILPIYTNWDRSKGSPECKKQTFLDLTDAADQLATQIASAFDDVLMHELNALTRYERAKEHLTHIVKMPDRLIDLFIETCIVHEGSIPESIRSDSFNFLTYAELSRMEQTVRDIYEKPANSD